MQKYVKDKIIKSGAIINILPTFISRRIGIVMKFRMILFLLLSLSFFSCRKEKDTDEGVLVRIGGETLTLENVIARIPPGIHPSDSAAIFNNVVDSWIRQRLLTDFAESRLYDLNSIERKVNDYRDKLIVMEYLSRMRDVQKPEIKDERVADYYEAHKKELITELPLVKGVFLIAHASPSEKLEIKNLLSEDSEDNINVLENNWMDAAVRYDYFKDKWIDWSTIADLIPYRFSNPDEFLANNKYFETDHQGITYFLQITDYLPGGSEQPYEFASTWISNLLTQGELAEYEKKLVESLIRKSIEEKKLEIVGYDPLGHK